MSRWLRQLENDVRIAREPAERDKRQYVVALTAALGKQLQVARYGEEVALGRLTALTQGQRDGVRSMIAEHSPSHLR